MRNLVPLSALAAVSLLAACAHHGARNFTMADPAPAPGGPTEPTGPHDPTPPLPAPDNTGALERTTNGTTQLVDGVLHVAGNATLGVGDQLGLADGVSGVPVVGASVSNLEHDVDGKLNSLAQVQVSSLPVAGATTPGSNQAIGVSALSQTASTGTVATIGVLNPGAPANVSVGGTQVLGGSGLVSGLGSATGGATGGANPLGSVGAGATSVLTNLPLPGGVGLPGKH